MEWERPWESQGRPYVSQRRMGKELGGHRCCRRSWEWCGRRFVSKWLLQAGQKNGSELPEWLVTFSACFPSRVNHLYGKPTGKTGNSDHMTVALCYSSAVIVSWVPDQLDCDDLTEVL